MPKALSAAGSAKAACRRDAWSESSWSPGKHSKHSSRACPKRAVKEKPMAPADTYKINHDGGRSARREAAAAATPMSPTNGPAAIGDDLKIDLKLITVPGDKMLIQELDPHSVSAGGIILPDMSQEKRNIAKVLKLSPFLAARNPVSIGGQAPIPSDIPRVGDYVSYAKYVTADSVMKEIGPRVCVVNFADVLAVLKPEAIEHGEETPTRQAPPSGSPPDPLETRDPGQENAPSDPQGDAGGD